MKYSLHILPRWSFAFGRYAKTHRDHGGPLAQISARQSKRLGETVYEAFASLDADRTGYRKPAGRLYGDAHGTGTATNKAEAVYRAISEAFERWAWHACGEDPRLTKLAGLEQDGSTTGFAAFPGLGALSARLPAYLEAAERWSLGAWWQRNIPHRVIEPTPWRGVNALEILSPIADAKIAVAWKEERGLVAYGFAAGLTLDAALQKAAVELGRNLQVLSFFVENRGRAEAIPANQTERRLTYFSDKIGHRHFLTRVSQDILATTPNPSLVVDRALRGPWTHYAHVWRCLFDQSALYDDGSDTYFHF